MTGVTFYTNAKLVLQSFPLSSSSVVRMKFNAKCSSFGRFALGSR